MDFLVLGLLCHLLDESEKENETKAAWPWVLGVAIGLVPLVATVLILIKMGIL